MKAALHNCIIQATKNEDPFNLPLGIFGTSFSFLRENSKKKSSHFSGSGEKMT